jgi:membrane protein
VALRTRLSGIIVSPSLHAPDGSPAHPQDRGANRKARLMSRFWRNTTDQLRDVAISRTAAALSFTTLLGLVPLVTVVVAVVAQFPIFGTWVAALETFLLRHMLPVSASAAVQTYVIGFADRAASLRGLSIALTLLTAILLFATIEGEINTIFRVTRGRSWLRRIPLYVLGITLGPLLLGASVWMSSWLAAQSRAVLDEPTLFQHWVVAPVPFLLTAIAFTLTYKLVPARLVRWAPAVVGGVIASIVFELMKRGFSWYIDVVSTYEVIYGALAALPVFLLWVYLCWVVVLAGAALVAVLDGWGRG